MQKIITDGHGVVQSIVTITGPSRYGVQHIELRTSSSAKLAHAAQRYREAADIAEQSARNSYAPLAELREIEAERLRFKAQMAEQTAQRLRHVA